METYFVYGSRVLIYLYIIIIKKISCEIHHIYPTKYTF